MDGTLPRFHFLKSQGRGAPIYPGAPGLLETWEFFDEFQILAALSRVQKKNNSELTEFSTKV